MPITFIKILFVYDVCCRNRQRALLKQVLCTRNLAGKDGNVSPKETLGLFLISSRREKWQVAFKDARTSMGFHTWLCFIGHCVKCTRIQVCIFLYLIRIPKYSDCQPAYSRIQSKYRNMWAKWNLHSGVFYAVRYRNKSTILGNNCFSIYFL